MIDIIAEYLQAMRATPFKAAEQLHNQFRIPWISVRAMCPVPMRVSFTDKAQRFYQPADLDGSPVWVLPVTCVDPEQPEEIEASDPLEVVSRGRVVDLLGFDPERPRRFVRRTGLAPVLGCIPPQYCDPDCVPVWRDVTDWLRAGCVGLVLLTDDPFERGRILCRIAAVRAEDPEHAAQLKAWLELPAYPRALTTTVFAMGGGRMSDGDHLWPAEGESASHARAKDNNGMKHKGADLDALTPEQLDKEKRRIAWQASRKLEKVNAQYAIAAEGGKVWVIQSRHDPNYKGRLLLDRFTFAEWSKLYMNEWVTEVSSEGKIKNKPLPGWWLHHPHRRQYLGGIVLDPTGTPDGYYNLWQGYTVKPVQGSWSKLKTHILEVVCCNDEDLFEYLMNWLALLLQRPGDPGETAIVLKGRKGTGKGILCRAILDILGQHGLHISSSTHLVGRFNSHLRDCIFLFADEAFFAGDRQHEGVLKALITEPSIAIEGKGRDVVVVKNLLHVIMASNEDWVIPATAEERRYVVFNVSDARIRNFPYFKAITAEMDAGGREAMLHELLNRDIDSFEVRDVPETEGLREQKALSLDSLGQWWSAVLDRGYVYKSKYGTPWFADWHEFISTELLYQSYSQFCTAAKPYGRKSREALGKFMSKLHQGKRASNGGDPIFEIDSIDTDRNLPRSLDEIAIARSKTRVWGYDVGTIDEARTRFEKAYGLSGVSG